MSTFSKSFASLGGFIAGDEEVIHYIKHHARSLIFSASIPPPNTAAALAALHVMQDEPERIQRVNAGREQHARELQRLGFNIGHSVSPIVPIIIGDDMRTSSPGSCCSTTACSSTRSSPRRSPKASSSCAPATWPPIPTSSSIGRSKFMSAPENRRG